MNATTRNLLDYSSDSSSGYSTTSVTKRSGKKAVHREIVATAKAATIKNAQFNNKNIDDYLVSSLVFDTKGRLLGVIPFGSDDDGCGGPSSIK
jgi:hypothetical protein